MRRRRTEATTRKLSKFSEREWDICRRGFESGKVIGQQDGLDMAEELPRRAGRLLRLPEVIELAGLSRPSIYRLERDGRFPKRVQISDNAVGWYEREVLAWRARRPRRGNRRREGE